MVEDIVPTGHLLSPMEASSTGVGLHLIELLAKGFSWSFQNSWTVDKAIGSFAQTEGKALLLKTIPTQLMEKWRSRTDAYLELLSVWTSIPGTGRYSVYCGSRRVTIHRRCI